MRKFTFKNCLNRNLLTSLCLIAGMTASAQGSIKILNSMVSDGQTYQPEVEAISSNHRYVTGPAYNITTGSTGMFIYDLETDNYAVKPAEDEFGAVMRMVSDDGVAIGYNKQAVKLSIDGTTEYLDVAEGVTGQARDASDDLSLIVGCHYDMEDPYLTTACIWKDGKLIDLPVPSDEELGFETNGSTAYYTTADGSIIVGYVVDNLSSMPLIVWYLQDDGTYKCDPVCTKYFSEWGDVEGRPYVMFSPQGLSRNGKYVSLNIMELKDVPSEQRMARYNLETKELEIYVADGQGDIKAQSEAQATAIADDGTMIGWVLSGSWVSQVRSAIIWNGNESEPKLLANTYPEIPEIAEFDSYGFNTVCDITPDARYIAGFAMDERSNYTSFVIDRGDITTGINNAASDKNATEVARYAADGTQLASPAKGLNIIKMSDGTTRKVIVK